MPAVKLPVITTALFLAALPLCSGQRPADVPSPSNRGFHWDPDQSQELDVKDTITRVKGLGEADRNALIEIIEAQLQRNMGDEGGGSMQQWRAPAAQTQIKLVDLNGDGVPEVIAQGVGDDACCSPTGNCPIWVFMKTKPGYKVLLRANSIQTFTIQRTKTNRFRDLVLAMHGSAFDQGLYLYRYSNGKYRNTACYNASWRRRVGDDYQDLKHPDVTPCD